VKDLRIEEAPAVKENKPPQVPNDPAILGVSLILSVIPNPPLCLCVQARAGSFCDEIFRM
jgi:hypothetical protein